MAVYAQDSFRHLVPAIMQAGCQASAEAAQQQCEARGLHRPLCGCFLGLPDSCLHQDIRKGSLRIRQGVI